MWRHTCKAKNTEFQSLWYKRAYKLWKDIKQKSPEQIVDGAAGRGGEWRGGGHRILPSPVCEWSYDKPVSAA